VARADSRGNPFRNPVEKSIQVKVGHQQHHRKQQDNRSKIDEMKGIRGPDGPDGHHQNRSDDGCARPVNFHSRKFSDRKDQIAQQEYCIGGELREFAQRGGREAQG